MPELKINTKPKLFFISTKIIKIIEYNNLFSNFVIYNFYTYEKSYNNGYYKSISV